jgi:hypothetical protein
MAKAVGLYRRARYLLHGDDNRPLVKHLHECYCYIHRAARKWKAIIERYAHPLVGTDKLVQLAVKTLDGGARGDFAEKSSFRSRVPRRVS